MLAKSSTVLDVIKSKKYSTVLCSTPSINPPAATDAKQCPGLCFRRAFARRVRNSIITIVCKPNTKGILLTNEKIPL